MHRQTIIQNHIQKSKPRTRKLLPPPAIITKNIRALKPSYSRPDLDSIELHHRHHTYTRARAHRMRPCRGFPRSMEGRGGEGNPFRGCPVIRGYIQERSREGWWCVTPSRGMNERNESGGRKESRRRASFRTVLEKVVWPYTFTDLHYPRLAPTLDTHHRPPQIVPLQRRVRGAAGRYTTSSVRPTK